MGVSAPERPSSDALRFYRPSPCATLTIVFGGLDPRVDTLPPFEFFKTFASSPSLFNTHVLFVRDRQRAWYFHGIHGESNGVKSNIAFLRKEIEALDARRVVCVGCSMGGFAAILYKKLVRNM